MSSQSLTTYSDPDTKQPLRLTHREARDFLAQEGSGCEYPVIDGIPIFIPAGQMTGSNRQYQEFYDKIAFFYDQYIALISWLCRWKGWRAARAELIRQVAGVRPGERVLEVGIGTGLYLELFPRDTPYAGVDISWKMLARCRRRAARLHRAVRLCLAQAEALPFPDESFDVVFSVGGVTL